MRRHTVHPWAPSVHVDISADEEWSAGCLKVCRRPRWARRSPSTRPTTPRTTSRKPSTSTRRLTIIEAALLALVAVLAAYSGFASAKWGTDSSLKLAKASTERNFASRAELNGLSTKNFDGLSFNAWFSAYLAGNQTGMTVAERRFRPQFDVAFKAWMATNPFANPNAPKGPTYMPEYVAARPGPVRRLRQGGGCAVRGGVPGRVQLRQLRPHHRLPGLGAVPDRDLGALPGPVSPHRAHRGGWRHPGGVDRVADHPSEAVLLIVDPPHGWVIDSGRTASSNCSPVR